jgi:hypothetical protein
LANHVADEDCRCQGYEKVGLEEVCVESGRLLEAEQREELVAQEQHDDDENLQDTDNTGKKRPDSRWLIGRSLDDEIRAELRVEMMLDLLEKVAVTSGHTMGHNDVRGV